MSLEPIGALAEGYFSQKRISTIRFFKPDATLLGSKEDQICSAHHNVATTLPVSKNCAQ